MELLYFILAAYGGFGELFNCPMCMGFWVGVFLCGINSYTELFTFEHHLINYFIMGCISSGTSYVLNMIFGDYGIKIQNLEAENGTH